MNKRKEGELDLKIVLLGKAYAGKTCLAQRYVNQMLQKRHIKIQLERHLHQRDVKLEEKLLL